MLRSIVCAITVLCVSVGVAQAEELKGVFNALDVFGGKQADDFREHAGIVLNRSARRLRR